MNNEVSEMWDAMKKAKYRDTLADLERAANRNYKDLPSFMNGLLDVVARAVHAEAGTLWYYAKFADGRIHPKATYGGGTLGDFSLAPGEGIAGKVIETGQGTMVADCQKDPRWSGKADANTGFITKSMICVPIADGDVCFGCIQVLNRTDGSIYDDKDYSFMEKLAAEVGRIVRKHSGDLALGCFAAFDEDKMTDLDAIVACRDKDSMLKVVTAMPQYKALGLIDGWKFKRYCVKLWKLCHQYDG